MPEQPQWSERTLDMPPQDPWSDQPTSHMAPETAPKSPAPTTPGPGPAAPKSPAPTSSAPGPAASSGPGPAAPQQQEQPDHSPFSRGRARVTERTQQFTGQFTSQHEPTGTGWPDEGHREPPRSLSAQIRDLRLGGEWSSAAALFAFVCWGIWALSSDGALISSFIIFVVSLFVAVGVFALARLVGRLVLEQRMGRRRHTARGSHVVAGVFLAGVGIAFLRQTEWVMRVVNWVTSSF